MFTVQKRQVFQFSAKTKKKNVHLNTHTELHKGAYSHRYTIKSPLDTLPFANTRVFMHAPAYTHTVTNE